MKLGSKIVGVGSFLPSRVVTNAELTQLMETSDEWIVQRTGIRERRWVQNGESTSDLALEASKKALANAGLDKSKLDLIILATLSPDHVFPGSGCFLQAKLGISNIPTLDIRQQCSGFIYGLSIADQFIRTGMYRNILVVGAEVHSKGLDMSTRGRDLSVLFGDGAGAVVVTSVEVNNPKADAYIYSTHLHSEGEHAMELCAVAPGSGLGKSPWVSHTMIDEGLTYPKMNGKKVFTSAVKRMAEVLMEGFQANQLLVRDIDLFLFHQANLRINEAVAEAMKIPTDKVFNTIEKYGNTTAATIPIGMDEALREGKLKPGMRVALVAFGSGFTWGASVLRY